MSSHRVHVVLCPTDRMVSKLQLILLRGFCSRQEELNFCFTCKLVEYWQWKYTYSMLPQGENNIKAGCGLVGA